MCLYSYFLSRCLFLILISIIFWPTSLTQCNTELPDNSKVILDSNTYHTVDSGGVIQPETLGWGNVQVDSIVYTIGTSSNTFDDNLGWRPAILKTGSCGPEYESCFQSTRVLYASVDIEGEMNWLVSSYYQTLANAIFIRITCERNTNYETDCLKTFQIFYYESDTNIILTESLLSQFLLADNSTNQLMEGGGVVVASFPRSKNGFYIGLLNQNPCADLTEFLFYYYECPATNSTSGIYSVSAMLSPSPADEVIHVNITNVSCILPFVNRDPLNLRAECYWNGTWSLPEEDLCVCMSGYYMLTDSSSSSIISCVLCPYKSNTGGDIGAVECSCEDDWYRGEGESVSESCGQSPSAVENVRVDISTSPLEMTVEWDIPVYLGNRNENQLHYIVSYYEVVSPESKKEIMNLKERQLVLSDVSESTEYVIIVTSLNGVSSVSDVYNRVNITVLSSFPDIDSISYNSGILEWSYTLYGQREYVFELSYFFVEDDTTCVLHVNSSECECTGGYTCVCTVNVTDLDSSKSISFQLFSDNSGILIATNLSYTINLSDTPTPQPTDITLVLVITIGVVLIVIIVFIIVSIILFFLIFFCSRSIIVRSKLSHKDTPLMESEAQTPAQILHDQLYQDPSHFEVLNKAIRTFTKELDQRDIDVASVIGNGEFGDVCKGTLRINNRIVPVAIKTLKVSSSEKNKEDFFKEASIMGQFSHENVIYLYGVTLSKPVMIVTPFMENGSLDKFLTTNSETLNLFDLGKICLGVAKGMNYLSNVGYVHRDLAARNILIDSDFTPKIADFGLSRITHENVYDVKSGGKIPVRWTAPEAILYRKFNMASDVWSFGVLMWEVMSRGQIPYGDVDNYTLLEQIQQGYRLPQPEGCPYMLHALMIRCWDTVPEIRPTFSELHCEISEMVDNNFNPRPRSRFSKSFAHSPLDFTSIEDWLTSLKLERYATNFTKNGFANLSSVWHMSEHDLLAIDIIPVGHRNKIMTSIHKANNKLSRTYSVRV
ncbi:Protein tyrosine kinase [Oopsacas minuta]|uniref:receptor protein-tyrosine kinase n=1 Tax=Oopsacas minuta TaxID=111878 RepID=A0AAV7JFD9_9METZ|nr:Protein tyrosine kinase [Oopsacas minuta]